MVLLVLSWIVGNPLAAFHVVSPDPPDPLGAVGVGGSRYPHPPDSLSWPLFSAPHTVQSEAFHHWGGCHCRRIWPEECLRSEEAVAAQGCPRSDPPRTLTTWWVAGTQTSPTQLPCNLPGVGVARTSDFCLRFSSLLLELKLQWI